MQLSEKIKSFIYQNDSIIIKHTTKNSIKKGFLIIDTLPLYFVSLPVIPSNKRNSINGTLLFAKILFPENIKELSEITHYSLELTPIQNKSISTSDQLILKKITPQQPIYIDPLNSKKIDAYTIIFDFFDKPLLLLKLHMNRPIYEHGKMSIRIVVYSMAILSLVFIIVILLLIDKIILRKLKILSECTNYIKTNKDLNFRFIMHGKDEISTLSNNFNDMLQAIQNYESTILKNERRYRLLFDNMMNGFALFKMQLDKNNNPIDYKYIDCNLAYEKIRNLKKAEIIGQNASQVVPDFDYKWIERFGKVALTGIPDEFERFFPNTNKYLHIYVYSPQKNYFAVIFEDITEQKKNLQLQNDLEIAQRTSKLKQQFLANMSHEMRTPLNGIIGMSAIMLQQNLSPQQNEQITIIKESSETLLTLINDILHLSKIESGNFELHPETFAIEDLCSNCVNLFKAINTQKNIQLLTNCAFSEPHYITADKKRIFQIITNLVSNAVKYTESGTITLRISQIAAQSQTGTYKIEVIDTGQGIPEEKQHLLFHKFSQIDDSNTRMHDGIGLGLSICKELISFMKGNIGVISEPGKGSNFWFTFEATITQQKPITNKQKQETAEEKNQTFNYCILIAEDKLVNRKILGMMLSNLGCTVEYAFNGQEAIEKFQMKNFDFIFMDIQMPVMDGITATQYLKNNFKNVPPVIALTANAMEGDAERFIEQGLDDYLAKPVTQEDIINMFIKWKKK